VSLKLLHTRAAILSGRCARSNRDKGATLSARALNVRVVLDFSASAALGRPVFSSGRSAITAAPALAVGRSEVMGKCLMQRQPWLPAKTQAGTMLSAPKEEKVWNLQQGACLIC
jgi:hypothetical protein